jgi:hypothetical protein
VVEGVGERVGVGMKGGGAAAKIYLFPKLLKLPHFNFRIKKKL